MRQITCLVILALLLAACSSKAAPPVSPTPPFEPPLPVLTVDAPPAPPVAAPHIYGPVPDVLARRVTEGGPQRVPFAAGDTVSKVGAYFLNAETGRGDGWLYPGGENVWWSSYISPDNRFVRAIGNQAGYLIDRTAGAVWQWDVETVRPVLITDRGALFAEVERKDLNLRDTGRLFWAGPEFVPVRTFTLEEPRPVRQALLSPDGERIALLHGEKPLLLLLHLGSESRQVLALPGADQWVGSIALAEHDGNFDVSAWVSAGSPATDMPRWHELIRRYDWQGAVLSETQIPGNYSFFSPDGKWVAWQEQDLLGDLAPVTVVAEASTLRPHLKVLGASTCFASVGSGGSRWLADSSGLILATNANQYRLLTLGGALTEPPGFAGLTWKGEPQPAPDKVDRFAIGRVEVLDGSRRLGVKLEGFVTPQSLDPWGRDSGELRFTFPPKAGGGACYELPEMPQLVLRAGEPVPEFPLVVQSSEPLPVFGTGASLPRGTKLKAIPGPDGRPGLSWFSDRWHLYFQTENGLKGRIDLTGNPLGWTK